MTSTLSFLVSYLRRDFVAYSERQLRLLGLSQGLLYFILFIGKHPGCACGEVSSALRADTGYTTRSLDKLEQGGFIAREKSQADKRAYTLTLTEKGESAFRRSHELFAEWDAETLQPLSHQERETLKALLQKLVRREGADGEKERTAKGNGTGKRVQTKEEPDE